MKKIICLIVCICLFMTMVPISIAQNDELTNGQIEYSCHVVTQYKAKISEKLLWQFLNDYSPTQEMTAAILGFFWRESSLKSNAVAHWSDLNNMYQIDVCQQFTEKVDEGLKDGSTKNYFIRQTRKYGGYGLGQWHSKRYLNAFYDFAQEWGTSIADAKMQCAFTIWSVQHQHTKHIDTLKDYSDLHINSLWMGTVYDGSRTAADTIYSKAKEYYKKNAE